MFSYNSQIAQDYADKAFTETIYDKIYGKISVPLCWKILDASDKTSLEANFFKYIKTLDMNFNNCKIINPKNPNIAPDVNITINAYTTGFTDVNTEIAVSCSSPSGVPSKTMDYNKTYKLYKKFYTQSLAGCLIVINDYDSGLYMD